MEYFDYAYPRQSAETHNARHLLCERKSVRRTMLIVEWTDTHLRDALWFYWSRAKSAILTLLGEKGEKGERRFLRQSKTDAF